MRKNEPPHSLKVCIGLADKSLSGKCSCVAGVSGYCHHVIGRFYYLAHCSPDRKVYDFRAALDGSNPFGLLEIKVVKEGETDLNNVRYLTYDPLGNEFRLKRNDVYFYQVQCQLGLTGLDWLDFFCYVSDSLFMCERILFDKEFFQEAKDKVDAFFFNYFVS